ncbi:hypothetical protein CAC42_7227 [Sphaceloma murrayae]|uniref:Golgi pH regulator n=1 Tax=Sphaceloma murrayae TaxID=2082308 RepID=A0A2K1QQL1_9PEZI|nr:hypothetical protein CAC42_7227 [Sphaceloma murrayae]
MLPSDDCDACKPSYLQRRLYIPDSSQLFSYLPFFLTFLVVSGLVAQRILPRLASHAGHSKQEHGSAHSTSWVATLGHNKITERRVTTAACAVTIALSTVLVELILCEISNTIDPVPRGLALQSTLISLLLLLIIVVPFLEIYSVVGSWRKASTGAKVDPVRVGLTATLLGSWLGCFWYLPYVPVLPATLRRRSIAGGQTNLFLQGCLKRVGIIGIALMAALAGFAAVSSIWQTLGVKKKVVKETDMTRKETGLASVLGMLETKQSRLRALDRRMSQQGSPNTGFLARVAGSIKGSSDANERQALEMEISGLETMAASLDTSLASLRSTYEHQQRAGTFTGRLANIASAVFAVYCIIRMATISWSTVQRTLFPGRATSTNDPVSHLLALLSTHYDRSLDYQAWSRQISFAMCGVILLLSFSAVLQTFRVFSKFLPSFIQRAQTSLPLIISQIAGTYVISSALLLRSSLPPEVSGVIAEALGTPLDARFSEGWFDGWFLAAAGLTVGGIMVSRKMGTSNWDDWDEAGDLEMGKMS